MKVHVKQSVCEGFGTCAKHAPELFMLDEWGYAFVAGDGAVPPGAEDRATRAILECPVHAIAEVKDEK